MAPIEEFKEEKQQHHDMVSLRHERRRIQKMKVIFGVFSALLLLSLVFALISNR